MKSKDLHEHCNCSSEHHHEHEHIHEVHEHDHHHHEHEAHEHEHTHHHHDDAPCSCGHDPSHEHDHAHAHHHTHHIPANKKKTIFILENLGCANCAAKMERKINELPGVEMAVITYATKQLAVVGDHPEKMLDEFQKICSSIEGEVVVIPREDLSDKKEEKADVIKESKKDIIAISIGAVLFVVGQILNHAAGDFSIITTIIFVVAYLILGAEIVLAAVKNLTKGHVFDENFLMGVATIAAFAIGDYAEAVGVMLFYRVGELFEEIAVSRSRSQIMEAVDLRPEVVQVIKDGQIQTIAAKDAKVGDVILVRPGDRVPLDGVIVEGRSQLDTSPVTGESVPVNVYPGVEVYSGCVNDQGVLKLEVKRPLSESMVTRILDSVENAAANKPKIDRFITRFARVYTPVVVLAAVATAIIPSLITGDWNHWIYTAITFLVISCPCALVLSVPLAFFSGIGSASKKGILFKGGASIEALKDVKAVVMDKTGTLTKGNFVVQDVLTFGRLTKKQILTIAADCEMDSTHPLGTSIVSAAKEQSLRLVRPKEAEEISGKGIRAVFPEGEVLCGNVELLKHFGVNVDAYQADKYRTEVLVAVAGKLEGCLLVADVIKPEAKEAIAHMKKQSLTTAILTGDVEKTAQAVAGELGIDEVHAQLLPDEKLVHLQKIREEHGSVMFVGDGINDAPVLAGADVGAAMGTGADAAIEAADVVFMTSSVDAIPEAVAIAKQTGNIAMQNVVFALAIKFLVMILGFAGYANMWMAVFADTGVAMLCVLNSIRILYTKAGNK